MLTDIRCANCNRLLGKLNGSGEIKCPRCGKTIWFDTKENKLEIKK